MNTEGINGREISGGCYGRRHRHHNLASETNEMYRTVWCVDEVTDSATGVTNKTGLLVDISRLVFIGDWDRVWFVLDI